MVAGHRPRPGSALLGKENCLYYFHAKDAAIDPSKVSYYGVTDMQSFSTAFGRAWQFRTVGFGHDLKDWADLFSVYARSDMTISSASSMKIRTCRWKRDWTKRYPT